MFMVSIIIPIYNAAKYLEACLDSIVGQTYSDYELILINDCSTDNSRDIISRFCQSHTDIAIKFIDSVENRGQSYSRNRGIEAAEGKYIMFVDADDTISPFCLEKLVDKAESGDYDFVVADHYRVDGDIKSYVKVEIDCDEVRDNTLIVRYYSQRRWIASPWAKLVKTNIIKDKKLYFKEGYVFEDELWNIMLATKVDSMGIVHAPLYNYYVNIPGSTINLNAGLKRWMGESTIYHFIKQYIEDEHLTDNPDIHMLFIDRMLRIICGLDGDKFLTYKRFKWVKELCYFDLKSLYNKHYLTRSQYLGWLYFNMPDTFSYVYYKFVCFYDKLKQ